jgi:hypothetical protein
MPAFLEPNQKFPVVLDIDKDKPEELRPTFFVTSLSMREQERLSDGLDESIKKDTTKEIFQATCELLSKYLVGWKNMGQFEFGCDVQEFLTHGEARELLRKILANQHVQPEEKKSSESQP